MSPTRLASTRRPALLAAALLGLAPAAHADWTTPLTPAGTALFDDATFYRRYTFPRQFAGQHAAGFDLLGPRLLGYARDGRLLQFGVQPLAGAGYDLYERLQPGAGDGLVAASTEQGVAMLQGNGALRWSRHIGGGLASPPVVADDGSIFYLSTHYPGGNQSTVHLHRLLPDGSSALDRDLELSAPLGELGFVFELQLHRLPGSTDLLVAGSLNYSAAFAARVSPQGERRWHWKAPGRLRRTASDTTVAPQADGGVLIAMFDTAGPDGTVHRLDAQGGTRSVAALPTEPGYGVARIAVSQDGRIHQLQTSGGGMLLLARDTLGRELWRQARPDGCIFQGVLLPTANGDLWISGFDSEGFCFERYSATGQLRFQHRARDFTPAVLLGTLLGERDANHMLVALRRRDPEVAGGPPPRVWDEWVAYDLQGVARERAELPALRATPVQRPWLVRDADGGTRLVGPTRDNARDRLEVVDAAGRHLGGADLDLRDDFGPALHAAACGAALCVAHAYGVKAYAEGGHGGAAWRTPTERIYALHAYRDGSTLLQHYLPDPLLSDIYSPFLRLLDPSGQLRAVPAGATQVQHFDPDLGALLTVDGEPQRLRADGSLAPAAALPGEAALGPEPPRQQRQWTRHLALPGGDFALLAAYARYEDFYALWQSRTLRVARVAPDGSVRWRRDFTGVGHYSELPLLDVALSHTPDGDLLLSGRYAGSGAVRLTALHGSNGEVLTQRTVPCPAAACEAADFSAGPGSAVFGFARAGSAPDAQHVALRLDGLFDHTQLPPQVAMTGIWFAPEATGQGVLVQAGADGSLGLAWFTHAASVQQDPAALRWYTLAGNSVAGTSEVPLTVHVARGGLFAAPPAVAAEPVGSARLWLANCDRLELRVRFDASYAVGGLDTGSGGEHALTLQRLLPAGEDCRTAGGALRPAARMPDRHISGVWYVPSISGQGLLLYRFATEAGAAPLLAGAWFTHDAPGSGQIAADSAHWFTLRGDGSSSDGTLPLAIDQTLGGHLGGVATRNTTRIGQGSLRAPDCDTLEFDYRFDDVEVARGFRGRSGRLTLQRLAGDCAPTGPE